MMFSRLIRTISRSRNVLSGANGGRSTGSSVYQSRYTGQPDDIDNLGFLKRYLGSLATNTEIHGSVYVTDINFLLANPTIPRFFSSKSEAPKKKNDEKEKKETPKGNNQKSESKEESTTEGDKWLSPFHILLMVYVLWQVVRYFVADEEDVHLRYGSSPNEMTFLEFKKKLMEPGLVDHIVISNNSVAKVYVKNSPGNQTTGSTIEGNTIDSPAAILKIGPFSSIPTVESFKERLEVAQKVLRIDTHDYVPVTYVSKKYWYQEVDRWVSGLFVLVALWCVGRWFRRRRRNIKHRKSQY